MQFLIPERERFDDAQRADFSLGLRRAVRYYNELVVPGIGGAWRVRHFSWAVAGIYLKHLKKNMKCKASAAQIANAIEALGNKLDWVKNKDNKDFRVRGKIAFKNNENAWEFKKLCRRRFYVQNTQRQQVTRALPPNTGLGFAKEGSTRFNGMELGFEGEKLAKAMIGGLENKLCDWVQGRASKVAPWGEALGVMSPRDKEKEIVLERIKSIESTTGGDCEKRLRLVRFFEKHCRRKKGWGDTQQRQLLLKWLKQNGGKDHADDIRAALAFEEMHEAGKDIVWAITDMLGDNKPPSVEECAENKKVKKAIALFRDTATAFEKQMGMRAHTDAQKLAKFATGKNDEIIREIAARANSILLLTGDNKIMRGPVFRTLDDEKKNLRDDGDELAGRPSRLFQFLALWRDCDGQAN